MLVRLSLDIDGDDDELAVPHPALLDDVIPEVTDGRCCAAHQRDLHATGVVEIDAGRRHHQVVMIRSGLCQSLGQLTHVTVVDVDQSRDAGCGRTAEARTSEIKNP